MKSKQIERGENRGRRFDRKLYQNSKSGKQKMDANKDRNIKDASNL